MSTPTQTRPVITIYPSPQEDVSAYLAAIRLASSVRNTMDAQKAGVDGEEAAVYADSYGRHHPNFPPPPSPTPGGREPVQILNETSSADSASNTTKPGFVHPRDRYPSPSRSMSTADSPTGATLEALEQHHGHFPPPDPPMSTGTGPILEDEAADTPAGVKLEALEQHHGHFPPPDPPMSTGTGPILEDEAANTPTGIKLEALEQHHGHFPSPEPSIGSTQASPGKPISRRTGPIPIHQSNGPSGMKLYIPGEIPPQCQLYATNTDVNNVTFAVCPVTKRTINPTHKLASRQLHFADVSSSHILAIRDTAMCEAPTGFDERLACGKLDGWFVLAFFILFSMIGLAWIKFRKHKTRRLDEEHGTATWPRLSKVSTKSSEAKLKPQALGVSTNRSEAKLREKIRKAHEEDQHLDEELSTEQYESVAWRSASHRAARAALEGSVEHDAGPVAMLPELPAELPAYLFEPSAPR